MKTEPFVHNETETTISIFLILVCKMQSFRGDNMTDNEFLNLLTHRLTNQIREEVKKEIYDFDNRENSSVNKNNVTEKIESYLWSHFYINDTSLHDFICSIF